MVSMRIARRCTSALLFGVLPWGCEEPADEGLVTVSFVQGPDRTPLGDGDPLLVELRPQGVYGATLDLDLTGVDARQTPPFSIEILGEDGERLAKQPFLSTSTGKLLDSGAVGLTGLPIVFADHVEHAQVDDAPADVIVVVESSPPVEAQVRVTLTTP